MDEGTLAGPVTTGSNLSTRLLVEDEARVTGALRRAVRHALLEHARLGNRVAIWRDDDIVEIDAAEALRGTDESRDA
jgi:hypothetical protein